MDEITNIVEKPKVILCEFDKKFLEIPKEILVITMENHQKYIPTFDKKHNLTTLQRKYPILPKMHKVSLVVFFALPMLADKKTGNKK